MTLEEHIDYHEDKITRLYEEHDRVQGYIHKETGNNSHVKAGTLMDLVKQLYTIETDIRSSIDTRMTLINIKNTSGASN